MQALIDARTPLRLDLGCGSRKKADHLGVDILPLSGVDVVAALPGGLQVFPDGCAERVFTSHFLEHLDDFEGILKEVHRILAPDGTFEVLVPHFSNPYAYSDHTHRRFFGLHTMQYFVDPEHQRDRRVPVYGPGPRFEIESVQLLFRNGMGRRRLPDRAMQKLVNLSDRTRRLYEGRFVWMYPCSEIHWLLRRRTSSTRAPDPGSRS